jgi:hypothetical protein
MATPGTPAPVAPTPIPRTAFGTTALVLGILGAILGLDWIVTGSHSARSSSAAGPVHPNANDPYQPRHRPRIGGNRLLRRHQRARLPERIPIRRQQPGILCHSVTERRLKQAGGGRRELSPPPVSAWISGRQQLDLPSSKGTSSVTTHSRPQSGRVDPGSGRGSTDTEGALSAVTVRKLSPTRCRHALLAQ